MVNTHQTYEKVLRGTENWILLIFRSATGDKSDVVEMKYADVVRMNFDSSIFIWENK